MATLTAAKRHHMASGEFALSGERFPINDVEHARLALSGASRALAAGNITSSEAATVRRKANNFLDAHEGKDRHADSVK